MNTRRSMVVSILLASAMFAGTTPVVGSPESPWHTFRAMGDPNCGAGYSEAVVVSPERGIVVGGSCSGAYLQAFDGAGMRTSQARRHQRPLLVPHDVIQRIVVLDDGRAVALGSGRHNDFSFFHEGCEAWTPDAEGVLREISVPVDVIGRCGDAVALSDGGLAASAVRFERDVLIRRIAADGRLIWTKELRGEPFPGPGVGGHALAASDDSVVIASVTNAMPGPSNRVLKLQQIDDVGEATDIATIPVAEETWVADLALHDEYAFILYFSHEEAGAMLRLARVGGGGPALLTTVSVNQQSSTGARLVVSETGYIAIVSGHPRSAPQISTVDVSLYETGLSRVWRRQIDNSFAPYDIDVASDGQVLVVAGHESSVRHYSSNGTNETLITIDPYLVPAAARFLGSDVVVVGATIVAGDYDLSVIRFDLSSNAPSWRIDEGLQPVQTFFSRYWQEPASSGVVVATNTSSVGAVVSLSSDGTVRAERLSALSQWPSGGTTQPRFVLDAVEGAGSSESAVIAAVDEDLLVAWRDVVAGSFMQTPIRLGESGIAMVLRNTTPEDHPPPERRDAVVRYDADGNRLYFKSFSTLLPRQFSGIAKASEGVWLHGVDHTSTPSVFFLAHISDAGVSTAQVTIPIYEDDVPFSISRVEVDGRMWLAGFAPTSRIIRQVSSTGAPIWRVHWPLFFAETQLFSGFDAAGRLWELSSWINASNVSEYRLAVVSSGGILDVSDPFVLSHDIAAARLDDGGGLVLVGVTTGVDGCGNLAATRVQADGRRNWHWQRQREAPGCDVAHDVAVVAEDIVVFGNSTVAGEPRAAVAFRFSPPIFGDGFE